ncbi:MAG: DUF47 family protein [Candidatus Sericytochromatia bacterium]|nr:DUF47 family protein [Candidatus Sericytochromatia bacterium]
MFKPFSRSADDLFVHLSALGTNLEQTLFRFDYMVHHWEEREGRFQAIRECEHEGDRLLRELQDYLKETFFVPGDREAIYALTAELDDIVDWALKISNTLLLYRVDTPPKAFLEMVVILRDCASALRQALEMLPQRKLRQEIDQHCLRVVALEDQADDVYRQGLEALFDAPEDLLDLLKWKDILDATDDAVDHANHVAYRVMQLNGALH